MQKVILYIQPQLTNTTTEQDYVRADLMESDLITLTQVIQDVKDIDKVFADYSKTFNLPASKTNNKLFKYWYNPDIEGFDNQIMANARIELNHFHFKDGKIKLQSVIMRDNKPSIYKVNFYGNTITLNDLIKEDKIEDLGWLNNFNHQLSTTNVQNGLSAGLDFTIDSVLYRDAVIYPLIAHSQSYIYNYSADHQNPVNISDHPSDRQKRGVLPEDLKPAITIQNIIKAIEQKYSITFKTGKFFDSSVFDNMYMWFHREKGKMDLDKSWLGDDDSYTCTGSDCTALTDPNYGSNSLIRGWFDLTTGIFNFISDLTQDYEDTVFTVEITPQTGYTTVPYSLEIVRLNNMETFVKTEQNQGTSSVSINMFTDSTYPNSPNGNRLNRVDLLLFAGAGNPNQFAARVVSEEDIYFNVEFTIQRTYTNTVGSTTTTVNLSGTMNSSSTLSATEPFVIITEQAPKIKILDFLNGLFKKYNLTTYLDLNNEIVVETLDDFYAGGDTLDLTEYIKTDEHTVTQTVPYNEIDFEYSDPKSILAQQFELLNNKKYSELSYVADQDKTKNYLVKLPFESMLYERLFDQDTNASTTVQIGTFLDIDLNPNIGKPLIFYGIHQSGRGTDGINFVDSTREDLSSGGHTATTLSTYWIPSAYNQLGNSSFPPSFNLNFGSEINTYTLTDYSGDNNSLFELYYENYIVRAFSKKTRLYNYKAVLPLKILLQLSLDDKIIVGTRLFTINKMTTKLQSGETEFELLNEAPQ